MATKIRLQGDGLHDPAIIAVDLGNNYLKVIAHVIEDGTAKTKSFSMPHGYRELSATSWQQMESSRTLSSARLSKSHVFKIEIGENQYKPLSIGRSAYDSSDNAPLLGSNKYVAGGIDALLTAVFCELFPKAKYPKGHNNLIVGYGFPPTEWQQIPTIESLIGKTHRIIDLSGDKRAFRVRFAIGWDENVGGLINAMSYNGRDPDTGQFSHREFKPGEKVIVFDSGGWLGSMAWATINENGFAIMDYDNTIAAIDGGAYTIRANLREVIKGMPELRGVRDVDLSDDLLDDVLRTGKLVLSGKTDTPHDMTASIKEAMSDYLNRVQMPYRNLFANGRFATHILMTGGTVDPVYDHLVKAFNHNSVQIAAKRSEIYMANGRGGMAILMDSLMIQGVLPDVFKTVLKKMGYDYEY